MKMINLNGHTHYFVLELSQYLNTTISRYCTRGIYYLNGLIIGFRLFFNTSTLKCKEYPRLLISSFGTLRKYNGDGNGNVKKQWV